MWGSNSVPPDWGNTASCVQHVYVTNHSVMKYERKIQHLFFLNQIIYIIRVKCIYKYTQQVKLGQFQDLIKVSAIGSTCAVQNWNSVILTFFFHIFLGILLCQSKFFNSLSLYAKLFLCNFWYIIKGYLSITPQECTIWVSIHKWTSQVLHDIDVRWYIPVQGGVSKTLKSS